MHSGGTAGSQSCDAIPQPCDPIEGSSTFSVLPKQCHSRQTMQLGWRRVVASLAKCGWLPRAMALGTLPAVCAICSPGRAGLRAWSCQRPVCSAIRGQRGRELVIATAAIVRPPHATQPSNARLSTFTRRMPTQLEINASHKVLPGCAWRTASPCLAVLSRKAPSDTARHALVNPRTPLAC